MRHPDPLAEQGDQDSCGSRNYFGTQASTLRGGSVMTHVHDTLTFSKSSLFDYCIIKSWTDFSKSWILYLCIIATEPQRLVDHVRSY